MATEHTLRPREEKRGGYSGGKPLSEMGPPVSAPSAQARPKPSPQAKQGPARRSP
jgi:hypothetical protein